jgi:seryl-tRNA synthetase
MPTLAEIEQAASAARTVAAEERRRDLIVETVRLALRNLDSLDTANHFLDRSQVAVQYWTENRERLIRRRDELNRQVRELGFHDIGHARGWLTVPKESKVE